MRDGATRGALHWVVGLAALVAPALHSASDDGAAFTYFAHTTLVALAGPMTDY